MKKKKTKKGMFEKEAIFMSLINLALIIIGLLATLIIPLLMSK
jgi:hypothetical protein